MLLCKSYYKIDGFDCIEVKCVLLVLHLDDVPPLPPPPPSQAVITVWLVPTA